MTAKDLLHKILDYTYLWSLPDRKYSKPATTRLAQIEALQEAFGLTKKHANPQVQIKYTSGGIKQDRAIHLKMLTDLDYLLHGEFLYDREEGADKELSEKVIATITALYPDLMQEHRQRPADTRWLFNNLFNFRKEIYKLTYPNGGMLEGFSAGLQYSFHLQQELKQVILDHLTEIDDTLWLILDPGKRTVSADEINYPKANLDEIDLAWRIDSY